MTDLNLDEQLANALDRVTADLRAKIVERHDASLTDKLEEYKKLMAEHGKSGLYDLSKAVCGGNIYRQHYWRQRFEELFNSKMMVQVDPKNNRINAECKVADDVAERQKAACEKFADGQLQFFKEKMASKLRALDTLVKVEFKGGNVENFLDLEYENGKVHVMNSVVYSYSKNGVPFCRYPTTFHDVTIAGQAVKNPSEAKVKKAFAALKMNKES